ncbi:hypothetical protein MAPG_06894 [Magnaporthiopsis poae ATCC 64411]|uniref:25S rRNA adenine-N(1) methyltransferase n=1 Tax=Magnaporthiopsis poae (strain ATCC 64411 / 73-15) TaxID=644358 RepID=A0A0C4E3A0_MAGP6|nr:hypothetical protein MAPG_06894 [Magnaporthiopsis poae ATCC 64411]
MGVKSKRTAKKSLSAGRPPSFHQKPKSITRKVTKALINTHHVLEKRLLQATRSGDQAAKASIEAEIAALGGLERYQQASLQGQRKDRGGDSSRVLMDWLEKSGTDAARDDSGRLRMLEVGALSTDNECSRSGRFDIERIDLNSQGEGILQQDFMERPLPRDDSERFDLISLSLVLNFVPDPKGRGEMLLRTLDFLQAPSGSGAPAPISPGLFLVLPAPCVSNSRYMDEGRLERIMSSLGFVMAHSKTTQRLVYYLWKRVKDRPSRREGFPKKELRSGSTRNNFAIVLEGRG